MGRSNGFGAYIRSNGHQKREYQGHVLMNDAEQYALLLKNDTTVVCRAHVSIDGVETGSFRIEKLWYVVIGDYRYIPRGSNDRQLFTGRRNPDDDCIITVRFTVDDQPTDHPDDKRGTTITIKLVSPDDVHEPEVMNYQ
jgi:hypothetical protein